MKAALFSMGSVSSRRVLEAMQRHFDEVDDIDIRLVELHLGRKGQSTLLFQGRELGNNYDCVYLKSSFRYALMQHALASYFEGKTYMPIRPEAFQTVNDKILTHLALMKSGIPMPETYITPTVGAAKALLNTLAFPIILKIPGGTQGKGVMFADSLAAAAGILDTLSELRQTVFIQEYIETGGTDIRAIVVGDKVVASMRRQAVREEKRANIHMGGHAEAVELDAHTKKVAVQTAKVLGAEICAVDLLESIRGPLVIEANLSPGLQGIMDATGHDIPEDMAKFLRKRTEDFKQTELSKETAQKIVEEATGAHQLVSRLDFRGERILLSSPVSRMSGLAENEDVIVRVKKGKIEIEKVS
jgi:ribosomal protein S6--L-glutamate ligase